MMCAVRYFLLRGHLIFMCTVPPAARVRTACDVYCTAYCKGMYRLRWVGTVLRSARVCTACDLQYLSPAEFTLEMDTVPPV